jgi:O-acetyl-ADP-ribose deacetylase (regulator of RNase III)
MRELLVGGRVLALAVGDIAAFEADALVNAANAALAGGGGVDGAIHRAAGPSVMADLRRNHPGGTPTGSAVLTSAGRLPARWVVHAVGPIWRGGTSDEPTLLASAYRSALELAAGVGARSAALPAISAGIYGYPVDQAARIGLETARDHLTGETTIEQATFVLYSAETFAIFETELDRLAAGR